MYIRARAQDVRLSHGQAHEHQSDADALIRGIDHVSAAGLPVLTVMCTNRPSAIDPAVERRAAQIFEFHRPNDEQRRAIFDRAFAGTGMTQEELHMLVELTAVMWLSPRSLNQT